MMKRLKFLGLLAAAIAAFMAFAAGASATALTSPTGTTYTSTLTASSSNIAYDGAFTTISCSGSHFEGKVETHGAGVTAIGKLSTLSFSGCNFPMTVLKAGSLEIHPVKTVEFEPGKFRLEACTSGECTGTVTSTGTELTMATSVGSCIYTTIGTDTGLLTPTNDTGGTARIDIGLHGGGVIPRTGGNFLCGSSSVLTGNYTFSIPDSLWIDS